MTLGKGGSPRVGDQGSDDVGHGTETEARYDAVLIAGPTASGKSALALRLARRCGGLVINADSMQVYRDLRVITARPSQVDESRAPHALFGHVDGAAAYSVSRWLADTTVALERARQDGLLPIVVGGTGLYFKALTEGLSNIPPVPDEIRAGIRAWAAGRTPEELHAELRRRDPATAAGLRPSDPQRITRALEVHAATGDSLAGFHASREPALLASSRWLGVCLQIDRGLLRDRVERRFDRMMEDGALREVAALADRRLDPSFPVMRALGVPPLLRHLSGDIDLETAVAEAKAATRRYIKRQETFARHQLPGFKGVEANQAESLMLARLQLV